MPIINNFARRLTAMVDNNISLCTSGWRKRVLPLLA